MGPLSPIIIVLAAALPSATARAADAPVRVYCVYHAAHGIRAVAAQFHRQTGIALNYRLGCRDSFYPTVRAAKDGDLYLTTSPANMAAAKKNGLLASEPRTIGSVVPVIVVPKGNPRKIRTLADLGRQGLVVAYPTTCIGNVALKIVAKNKLNDTVRANMTIRTGNRTGVLGPLATGKAHAAITWSCAIIESGRKDIEAIAIPKAQNVIDPVLIAMLKTRRDKARAQAFLDYLATDSAARTLKDFCLRR